MTPIINATAPLSTDGLTRFSGIWSSSYNVKVNELFEAETRYTIVRRRQTSVNVTITKTIFYINNVEEPIARQTEIIFRNLLFIFLVLDAFGFLFLINKLLLAPVFNSIVARSASS